MGLKKIFLIKLMHCFFSAVSPHIVTHKHSENANENDKAVLLCECHSYPLVTDWAWVKISDSERTVRLVLYIHLECCLVRDFLNLINYYKFFYYMFFNYYVFIIFYVT